MPGFVTIELITADARVSHGATARFNTLPTTAVPGPPRRPHKHPMETWNKILGLAVYCHPCLHTFVFLASQVAFTSYDTTGTVVTQTYLLWYHGNSHGDSGNTNIPLTIPQEQSRRQWWDIWVTETVVRLTIPREQSWRQWWDDTMGTVLRRWSCRKILLMTKIHDKRCRTTW